MKKFNFELQEILDIRKFQQQSAEADLAKALAEEKKVQDKIDALAENLVKVKSAVKESKNFEDITRLSSYSEFVKKQTEYFLEQLTELKLVSDEKREALKKCMQKTDALEDLKKNQKEEFSREQKKAEQTENDNIITGRFGRENNQ